MHKREMELRGLMAFIPLLDSDSVSSKRKKAPPKSKESVAVSQGESSESLLLDAAADPGKFEEKDGRGLTEEPASMKDAGKNDGTGGTSSQKKKVATESKRPRATRKSSLRRSSSAKGIHRKRVSLVVDDHIVHPSDSLVITSPLSDSTTNASSSMEDVQESLHHSEHDPVHHSLHPDAHVSMPPEGLSASPQPLVFEPPAVATATFIEHDERLARSPHDEASIIYADEAHAPVSTYVGGLSGSGVDDLDQAGSYGYPSSLGASYMESYMASRPLSVRLAAVEKAELAEEEAKKLLHTEERADVAVGRAEEMDADDGFLGAMDNI